MNKIKEALFSEIFLEEWRPYLWIIVIGYLLYSQTFSFGLTYLDDNFTVNSRFYSEISNIFQAFRQNIFYNTGVHEFYYRPIATISMLLDFQIGKTDPFVYHLTNVMLHLINSCLLFKLLTKLGNTKGASFFVSMVFTVHPALAQNVAWIPGRADTQLAVFVIPSFIFFLCFLETRQWKYLFLHLLFFAAALFTKETAVLLIVLCLIYAFLSARKRFFSPDTMILMSGWAPILIFWALMRNAASTHSASAAKIGMLRNLISNLPAILIYAGKLILPFNLSVFAYMRDTSLVYGIISVAVICALLAFSRNKRGNMIVFGILWFLLFLLPTLVLSDRANLSSYVFEHRTYLPAIGLLLVLLETDAVKKLDEYDIRSIAACSFVIALFAFLTFYHCKDFADRIVFWESAVRTSPHSSLAHSALGTSYYSKGLKDEAEKEYKKTLELNPHELIVHNNLGLIYADKGMYKKAEEEFNKELSIDQYFNRDVIHNLGWLYAKQGRLKDAARQWKKAIEADPTDISAYTSLAVYYYNNKEYDLARPYFIEIMKKGGKIDPVLLKKLNIKP